jgi:hypothetical protein
MVYALYSMRRDEWMRPFCVTVPLLVKRIKKSGSRQAENSRSLRLVKEKKGDMPVYRMSLLQSRRQCAPADHWHEQIVHLIVPTLSYTS